MKQFRNTIYYLTEDLRIYNSITKKYINGHTRIWGRYKYPRTKIMVILDRKRKSIFIYRIIAEVYIPNPENKPCINHKDGNPMNNALDNLEWCTYAENTYHALETGLKECKIGMEKACEIRYKYNNEGISQKELASMYNVGFNTINKIVRNLSWV